MSLRTLTEIADKQVKRVLESVDGVGEVTMSGDQPREVHIVVDIEKLNAHGLSIDQVRDAIQSENVEVPGGTLEQGKWEVGLRTLGRIDATDQFKNIIVKTVNGTPIRMSDIGYVEDTTQKATERPVHGRRQPGDPARHPARVRREHHQGHRRDQGEAADDSADAAQGRHISSSPTTIPISSTPRSNRWKSTSSGAACSRRWSSCSSSATSAPC